jgi:hypothetical protein
MALSAYERGNAAVETDYFMMANEAAPALVLLVTGGLPSTHLKLAPFIASRLTDIKRLSPQMVLTGGAEFARRD